MVWFSCFHRRCPKRRALQLTLVLSVLLLFAPVLFEVELQAAGLHVKENFWGEATLNENRVFCSAVVQTIDEEGETAHDDFPSNSFPMRPSYFSRGGSWLDDEFTAFKSRQLEEFGKAHFRCFFRAPSQPLVSTQRERAEGNAGEKDYHHLTMLLGPSLSSFHSPLETPIRSYFRNFSYSYALLQHAEDNESELASEDSGAWVHVLFFQQNRTKASPLEGWRPPVSFTYDRVRSMMVGGSEDGTPHVVARREHLYGVPSGRYQAVEGRQGNFFSGFLSFWGNRARFATKEELYSMAPVRKLDLTKKNSKPLPSGTQPHPPFYSASVLRRLWQRYYHKIWLELCVDGLGSYPWFSFPSHLFSTYSTEGEPRSSNVASLVKHRLRRMWQERRVTVTFTVREWSPRRPSCDTKTNSNGEGCSSQHRHERRRGGAGYAVPPSNWAMAREGKENFLHIVSFPPVAKRAGSETSADATKKPAKPKKPASFLTQWWRRRSDEKRDFLLEEFVCDYNAIREAKHHYLRDPVVFLNQPASPVSRSNNRKGFGARSSSPADVFSFEEFTSEAHTEPHDSEEAFEDETDDVDRFFASLIGVLDDDESAASESYRQEGRSRSSAFNVDDPTVSASPWSAIVGNLLLFPPRLVSALLFGTGGAEAMGTSSPLGLLALFLPSQGLLGFLMHRGVNEGSLHSWSGGFSYSASQLAAKEYSERVVGELGPTSVLQAQEKKRRQAIGHPSGPSPLIAASLFSRVRQRLDSTFVHDEEEIPLEGGFGWEEDDHIGSVDRRGSFTRYEYTWQADLPATRSVCVALAPTPHGMHEALRMEEQPYFSMSITEEVAVKTSVLYLIGLSILLGHIKRLLFPRFAVPLQVLVMGLGGIFLLALVAAYYMVNKARSVKWGKSTVFLVLTAGGAAACADGLLALLQHFVLAMDASYADWRLYSVVGIGAVGFCASFILRRIMAASLVSSITETTYAAIRLALLASAFWLHAEAAVATLVIYTIVRLLTSAGMFVLWLRYDPLVEEAREKRREDRQRFAHLALPPLEEGITQRYSGRTWEGRRSDGRVSLPFRSHRSRSWWSRIWNTTETPEGEPFLATLLRRYRARTETKKHFTVPRVTFRFLRRLNFFLLAVVRHSLDDLCSDEDSLDGSAPPSRRSSMQRSHESPPFVSPRVSEGRVSRSEVFRTLAVPTYAVLQHFAEKMEERKHPHRYYRWKERVKEEESREKEKQKTNNSVPPLSRLAEAVRRKTAERVELRYRTSSRLSPRSTSDSLPSSRDPFLVDRVVDKDDEVESAYSSCSSVLSDEEERMFGEDTGFVKHGGNKLAAQARFREQLNDPLEVFPAFVFQEAKMERKGRRSRSSQDSRFTEPRTLRGRTSSKLSYEEQGRAYTKVALEGLARTIRQSKDTNALINRLENPQQVLHWAKKAAPSSSDEDY